MGPTYTRAQHSPQTLCSPYSSESRLNILNAKPWCLQLNTLKLNQLLLRIRKMSVGLFQAPSYTLYEYNLAHPPNNHMRDVTAEMLSPTYKLRYDRAVIQVWAITYQCPTLTHPYNWRNTGLHLAPAYDSATELSQALGGSHE